MGNKKRTIGLKNMLSIKIEDYRNLIAVNL